MKKLFSRILGTILIIHLSGFFSFFSLISENFYTNYTHAQSPSTPIYTIYRDAGGGENITTTAQALSWDTLISQDSEIPIDGTNSGFNLSAGGNYLAMYSVPIRSTGGANRSEIQAWLQLNGSSNLEYGYSTSYIRRTAGDYEGYNEGAAIIEASAGDNLSVMLQKTDTNTASMERTPNRSGINILKLDDDWNYARLRPSSIQAMTTSWAEVGLGTIDTLDTAGYSVSGNDITLTEGGKYLVTYNVATQTSGTDRTNNEMRLTLDGLEVDSTRSTAYVRAQQGNFTGISSYVGIIEASSNQVLNLEARRESSMQGTTNTIVPTKTGITITKLPDSADYMRIGETTGGQDISNTSTPLIFDTTIEQGNALQHDSGNTSEIDVNATSSYLMLHSIYNARTGNSNTGRENPYITWEVDGVDIRYGNSGSYNRTSNDGDGITNSSASSAGVILSQVPIGSTIELTQINEATNGESFYNGSRMGIQGVDLTTLFEGESYLSQSAYRWRDDSSDFDTASGWIAPENSSISNISKNETLRVRMKLENESGYTYGDNSQFELQWAKTTHSCIGGLAWKSISDTGDAWEMVDSPHISPNAETSTTVLLSNISGNTHIQSEGYHSSDGLSLANQGNTFTDNTQKEYEFSINATTYAEDNAIYCFRLYDVVSNDELGINNFPKLQMSGTPTVLADIWGEARNIIAPINGGWTTITFEGGPYTNPVIIGRTNTYNDGNEALVFESRNITSTTAEVRLCDSDSGNSTGCQAHGAETIGYMIVDAAQVATIDGLDAGTFQADESFDTVGGLITTSYNETFTTIPYVFTSIQSSNGDTPIVTRVSASSISSFSGGICQQISTDGCNPSHPNETFGWIAIDPTINPFFKDMDIGTGLSQGNSWEWSTANFSTTFTSIPVALSQTVTNFGGQDAQIDEIQNVSVTGMQFRACEIDTDDDCDTHAVDTIRWLAIEEGVFANEFYLNETYYRWYENNGNITPATPLANENTVLGNLPATDQVRLRMLLQNSVLNLPSSVLNLKLQYGVGLSCDTISSWSNVGAVGGSEDWLHYDNTAVIDGATIPSSLLFGGGHNLQSYSESLPTVSNPNPIPAGEWGEWDFSLIKNNAATSDEYCFRVVTQNDDEIEYSEYARINTSDTVDPILTAFSPDSNYLLPIGTFIIDYDFFDADSGIDILSQVNTIQKWDGTGWGGNIADSYASLDTITTTNASYQITDLPYGRYRAGFGIRDNSGNSIAFSHEFYVDEVEFTISRAEVDIGDIDDYNLVFTSDDILTVTVKTVGAGFDIFMSQQADMLSGGESIPEWNGARGFGYEPDPFGTVNTIGSGANIASELQNLNINGEKNVFTYDIKYSVLLDVLDAYVGGEYESLLDFHIDLDYN